LLLLTHTQGCLLPTLVIVLLLLIVNDLHPFVFGEVAKEGLGVRRFHTLVSQLETQVREMLMVVGGGVLGGFA
jgi:hypothetical protein